MAEPVKSKATHPDCYDLPDSSRLKIEFPAILMINPEGNGKKLDMQLKDQSLDLSAVLGNNNGRFHWGSAGFEHGARPRHDPPKVAWIEEKGPNEIFLCADLQDKKGVFKPARFSLSRNFHLKQYVHPVSKIPYYKLAPKHLPAPPRSLVLCFDGTSNHFSNLNTNVVKLMQLLKKSDPNRQMVYYQTGVGTYAPPGLTARPILAAAKKVDEGVAWYLDHHVMDGYKYLVQTYRVGDRISIFGFSRGAFTARALAGMVHCVGLLPRDNLEHIPFAYEVYKKAYDHEKALSNPLAAYGALNAPISPKSDPFAKPATADKASASAAAQTAKANRFGSLNVGNSAKAENVNPEDFKRVFCSPVAIDFVGVWDTVTSVGSILPKTLPWIKYNPSIRNFRQALALDERRANFIPSLWDHGQTRPETQDVQEVWFKGGHTDVGGGAPVPNPGSTTSPQSTLSNISLRWMVRQCLELDIGIIFDYQALETYRKEKVLEVRPNRAEEKLTVEEFERKLLERSAELDKEDIKHTPYDAMGWNLGWHALEVLPVAERQATGRWLFDKRTWNLYAPRSVNSPPIKSEATPDTQPPVAIHSSVVYHLLSQEKKQRKYIPSAKWCGYSGDERPFIEDGLEGKTKWHPNAWNIVLKDQGPRTWGQSAEECKASVKAWWGSLQNVVLWGTASLPGLL